jgi:hypothetical protein
MAYRNYNYNYYKIPETEVPEGVRWDVPRQNQGQIVTASYADWPWSQCEACHGARYQKVYDAGDQSLAFHRRDGDYFEDDIN